MIVSALARMLALPCLLMTAACASDDSIDPDGAVFDAVESDAVINLSGTEPFWGLEIEPDGKTFIARYSTPENIDGSDFIVSRFAGNNGLGFSGEFNGSPVQIAVTPGACSDGMSDRTYPYTATVTIGGEALFGCGYTSDEPFTGDEAP